MRTIPALIASLALMSDTVAAGIDTAGTCNARLFLEAALPAGRNSRGDVEIEVPVRDGTWGPGGWVSAYWYGDGRHVPRVTRNDVSGETRRLRIEVAIGPDPRSPGGTAVYDIELRACPRGRMEGTYTGTFQPRGNPLPTGPDAMLPPALRPGKTLPLPEPAADGEVFESGGNVHVFLQPPWPDDVKSHCPPEPGEHPRLMLRKADIALLRRRAAQDPAGKAMRERTLQTLGFTWPENQGFSTWPAAAQGFAFLLTADRAHADRARQVLEETVLNAKAGRGDAKAEACHHARRLVGLALAYDFCYDAWDAAFRTRCTDEIQRRVWELHMGEFEGQPMEKDLRYPWAVWHGIKSACMGIGACAIRGEKNSLGRVMEEADAIAHNCAHAVRMHFLTSGVGTSGYSFESAWNQAQAETSGLLLFAPAYANTYGIRIDAGPLCDFLLAGKLLAGDLPEGCLWPLGLYYAPADMLPGLKREFNDRVGLEGNRTFGIDNAVTAAGAMAFYPYDTPVKAPAETLRWCAPDPRKGYWIFRPTYGDSFFDVIFTMRLKSEPLKYAWLYSDGSGKINDFHLQGGGRYWSRGRFLARVEGIPDKANEHLGGRITSWQLGDDRTCIMNWDMSRAYWKPVKTGAIKQEMGKPGALRAVYPHYWYTPCIDYGIRATRSMAVDAGDKSGSMILMAIVETFRREVREGRTAKPLKVTWWLPDQASPRHIDGQRFVIGDREDGPCLSGVMVPPATLLRHAVGTEEAHKGVFVVLTIQDGPPPEYTVEGEGLRATVTVGKRRVRFDGQSLVLE